MGKTLQKTEDLPLWEFRAVKRALEQEQWKLEGLKQDLEAAEAASQPEIQKRIRYAEQRTAVHQKAYMASQHDTARLCPGRSPSSLDRRDSARALEMTMRIEHRTRELESGEQAVRERKAWIAQLPEGADEARRLAHTVVDEKEREMARNTRDKASCVAQLNLI